MIIVTTRKESVASMMDDEKISMDILSSEVSWSLFRRHAFETIDPKKHPELEVVGKEIATKCNGLPLVLKHVTLQIRS
uniref:Disease resistance protein R3a n=1 Tax=Solanum tuberosum TaxID=4113 RepID=M1CM53_SOLTU